jgi:hypothetical protein
MASLQLAMDKQNNVLLISAENVVGERKILDQRRIRIVFVFMVRITLFWKNQYRKTVFFPSVPVSSTSMHDKMTE